MEFISTHVFYPCPNKQHEVATKQQLTPHHRSKVHAKGQFFYWLSLHENLYKNAQFDRRLGMKLIIDRSKFRLLTLEECYSTKKIRKHNSFSVISYLTYWWWIFRQLKYCNMFSCIHFVCISKKQSSLFYTRIIISNLQYIFNMCNIYYKSEMS